MFFQVAETFHNFRSTIQTIYFCLKYWLGDQEWDIQCFFVKQLYKRQEFESKVLDIDLQRLNKSFTDVISQASSSKHLGSLGQRISDLELDYCTPETVISVVVLGHNGDNLTGFLMTSNSTPPSTLHCHQHNGCLMAKMLRNGMTSFSGLKLSQGTVFSCVRGENVSYGCSNGIYVDETPPKPGHISVQNINGLISSRLGLTFYIEPFIEDALLVGTEDRPSIANYLYGIGTFIVVNNF